MFRREELKKHLLESGAITNEKWQEVEEIHKREGTALRTILLQGGYVTPREFLEAASKAYRLPYVEFDKVEIRLDIARELPKRICDRYGIVAFDGDPESIHVAFVEPGDLEAVDVLRSLTNKRIVPYVAIEDDIRRVISFVFQDASTIDEYLSSESQETTSTEDDEDEMIDNVPLARYINSLIDDAISKRTSDIHIEPHLRRGVVRFRIDGLLREVAEIPKRSYNKVVSRIKLQAGLDIAVTHRPQDGRIRRQLDSDSYVDIRVSTVPTVNGEKIVMRILDQRSIILTLEGLGLTQEYKAILDNMIDRPHGLIVVCGPTGSGKSTTLYTILNKLNRPEVNIISLEDPVEYRLNGISQIQVNERQGLTFASGLRAILRQDPDIILVGEVRDEETAKLAVQAALTGHLVFTTLHTNTAVGAITRLVNMSVEPFLVASALVGSISQRLLRRICTRCKTEYVLSPRELAALGLNPQQPIEVKAYKGQGCIACHGTGYQGRVAVFEMLTIDDNMRDMIASGTVEQQLAEYAKKQGMKSLLDSAREAVLSGVTDVAEMLRVIHKT